MSEPTREGALGEYHDTIRQARIARQRAKVAKRMNDPRYKKLAEKAKRSTDFGRYLAGALENGDFE